MQRAERRVGDVEEVLPPPRATETSQPCGEHALAGRGTVAPGAFRPVAAASCSSRAQSRTLAPSRTKASTMARPRPWLPPVTMALRLAEFHFTVVGHDLRTGVPTAKYSTHGNLVARAGRGNRWRPPRRSGASAGPARASRASLICGHSVATTAASASATALPAWRKRRAPVSSGGRSSHAGIVATHLHPGRAAA